MVQNCVREITDIFFAHSNAVIWGAASGSTSLFLFSIVFIKAGVVRIFSASIALQTFYLKYGKVANPEIFGDHDPDPGKKTFRIRTLREENIDLNHQKIVLKIFWDIFVLFFLLSTFKVITLQNEAW